MSAAQQTGPRLPNGREVELPGGSTFVREVPGPPGAPAVVLIHGWTATADLNWFTSYEPLGRRFRVLAFDQRGHGRGIRPKRSFRLEDCADDVIALADLLGLERVIVTGYSMGGPIAQLAWRRHPDRVAGLVLCATARNFSSGVPEERLWFISLNGLAMASRLGPATTRKWLSDQFMARRGRDYDPWAFDQIQGHDWTSVFEAGRELGRYSSVAWAGEIDVPVGVVVTTQDRVVPVRRQLRLAESIPESKTFTVAADHDGCVAHPELFAPALVSATTWVAERSRARSGAGDA